MPRRRSENELEALRAQAIALDQKIREAAARDRAKRDEAEHRRQVLVGQAALEQMEADSSFAATMLPLIDRRARAAADRALFDLPPIPREQSDSSQRPAMNGGHNGA
jgi:hypothetical protein